MPLALLLTARQKVLLILFGIFSWGAQAQHALSVMQSWMGNTQSFLPDQCRFVTEARLAQFVESILTLKAEVLHHTQRLSIKYVRMPAVRAKRRH